MPWIKGRKPRPEPLEVDEGRALMKKCCSQARSGIRDRALTVLLYRGSLRLDEALQSNPKELNSKQGTVRILRGKGDQSRVVGLDDGAWAILQRWLDKRTDLGIKGHQRVFCTLSGKPLLPSHVRALLPRLSQKAGIDRRVHSHGLRHTHAFELANEGHPLQIIRAQFGHSSPATTDRHIRHLAPQEVADVIRSRTWQL